MERAVDAPVEGAGALDDRLPAAVAPRDKGALPRCAILMIQTHQVQGYFPPTSADELRTPPPVSLQLALNVPVPSGAAYHLSWAFYEGPKARTSVRLEQGEGRSRGQRFTTVRDDGKRWPALAQVTDERARLKAIGRLSEFNKQSAYGAIYVRNAPSAEPHPAAGEFRTAQR